jgi:NUMOD3 motif
MNHYVYLIEQRNALPGQPVQYIGVRSCECNVGDDPYMSSSKYVKAAIKQYGREQFNKIILKRFDNRKDAMAYEIQLHEEFNVTGSNFFFNKAKQKTDGFSCGPGELNPFYGKKHTDEYKKKLSALLKTKDCRQKKTRKGEKHTPEVKAQLSAIRKEYYKTHRSPRFGVVKTEEQKKLDSLAALNQPRYKCVHCDVITIKGNLVRWHNDMCRNKGE